MFDKRGTNVHLYELKSMLLPLQITSGSPSLVMPWSGEHLAFVDGSHYSGFIRPKKSGVRGCSKKDNMSRLETFSTRLNDVEVRTLYDSSFESHMLASNKSTTFPHIVGRTNSWPAKSSGR